MTRVGLTVMVCAVLLWAGTAHAAGPTALDHYLCYKGALVKGETPLARPYPSKQLTDQFGTRIYDAKKPVWLCNPATKTEHYSFRFGLGLDVVYTPTYPAVHLEGYRIALTKQTPAQEAFSKQDHSTVDQFGSLNVTVKKPESLLVRASKTDLGTTTSLVKCGGRKPPCAGGTTCVDNRCLPDPSYPTPPANDGSVDNFLCYTLGLQKGTTFTPIKGQVTIDDQFWGPIQYDIEKPTRLCAPVNKLNENPGAETHDGHLVCYQVKAATKFTKHTVALGNGNFPDTRLAVNTVKELCVPARKDPPSCPGQLVGGFCWVRGDAFSSCDSACAAIGQTCAPATITYAGSEGSGSACQLVLHMLGIPCEEYLYNDDCTTGAGCGYGGAGQFHYEFWCHRCTSVPTSCEAPAPSFMVPDPDTDGRDLVPVDPYRACACQ